MNEKPAKSALNGAKEYRESIKCANYEKGIVEASANQQKFQGRYK